MATTKAEDVEATQAPEACLKSFGNANFDAEGYIAYDSKRYPGVVLRFKRKEESRGRKSLLATVNYQCSGCTSVLEKHQLKSVGIRSIRVLNGDIVGINPDGAGTAHGHLCQKPDVVADLMQKPAGGRSSTFRLIKEEACDVESENGVFLMPDATDESEQTSHHRTPLRKPLVSVKHRRSSTTRRRMNEMTYPELEAEHRKGVTVGGLTATCGLRDFIADACLMSLRRDNSCQDSGALPVGKGTPKDAKRQASESDDRTAPHAKRVHVDADVYEDSEAGDNAERNSVALSSSSASSAPPKSGDGNNASKHKGSDYSATFGPVIRMPDPTSVGFENVFGDQYEFKLVSEKQFVKDGITKTVRTYRCLGCVKALEEKQLKRDVPLVKTMDDIFVERDPDCPLGNNHFCTQ